MLFAKRRYYYWLITAYIKKWKKTIIASLLIGVFSFFAVFFGIKFFLIPNLGRNAERIGIVGFYTIDTLPRAISQKISFGLTQVDEDGKILPGAAESYEIKNGGKEYIFHLKKGIKFQNGIELTNKNLELHFSDVKRKNIGDYTVVYELKESYAPFLVSVSKPIFLQGTVGLGRYKITRVEFNAGFLKSLYLVDADKNSQNRLQIYFYPTEEALKTAYALGEIDKALGLSDTNYQKINVSLWQNTRIKKSVNYNQLLTLFYNTKDPILSNPKVRQALNSALPERFDEGEKAYGPFRTNSSYFAKFREYNIYNKDLQQRCSKNIAQWT